MLFVAVACKSEEPAEVAPIVEPAVEEVKSAVEEVEPVEESAPVEEESTPVEEVPAVVPTEDVVE